MNDRAGRIRETMRRSWGERTREYARTAGPNTSAYAALLIGMVQPRPGERVIDVATGPGVVALAAAQAVGPSGQVLATDLTPAWSGLIAEAAAQAGLTNVSFREMGAEHLEVPDGSFDLALCQFGLMFVPEPVQALREMRRALREGGRLGVVVWSTADQVHLFDTHRMVGAIAPPPPPEERMPTPLQLGEPGLIERLVAEAGWRDLVSDRLTLDFVVSDSEAHWQMAISGAPPHVTAAVATLSAAESEKLHRSVIEHLESYRRDGEIRLPSEAIFVTAFR